MNRPSRFLLAAPILVTSLALGFSAGCDPAADAPPAPLTAAAGRPQTGLLTTKVRIGSQEFKLEIADGEKSREIGLMHRDRLPDDGGMIFVFPAEEPLGFWMKNTRIPLDIIYADATGKVVEVAAMKPFDLTSVPSRRPAKYAIELNAGKAKAIGIRVGDTLALPSDIR